MMMRLWREDEGVLTFEWILLVTLLVIGIVGGVAGVRDAIIHECQGVAAAMVSLDQSYSISSPLTISVHPISLGDGAAGSDATACSSSAAGSAYTDTASIDTGRATVTGQSPAVDGATPCDVTLVTPGGSSGL